LRLSPADGPGRSRKVFSNESSPEDVAQLGQVGADLAHHRHMIEAAPQRGHDGDLGLGKAHHEAQLALAKDRHQRVGHGADAAAGKEQRDELPPVRQLKGNHVAGAGAEIEEARRDPVDTIAELGVGEADLAGERAVPADEGRAIGRGAHGVVEVVDGQPVRPQPSRRLDAALRQIDVECHGAFPPGPCLAPLMARALATRL
jgi:hypothetical protein